MAICPVVVCDDPQWENLTKTVGDYMDMAYADKSFTFKVESRRADKSYPKHSMEINADTVSYTHLDVYKRQASSFAQGMEMIYKQLTTVLEGVGVSPIEAEGKEFDPMLHNAVMQSPSEDYDSGIIIQELQKGYMYKEKVLRHSMVIVAE